MKMNPFITASLTNYCNLGCSYCVAHSYDWVMTDNSRPRMIDFLQPIALSKWVKKHWPENTLINITGGEPMMHPHAEDAIRYLADNHKVVVFTNGLSVADGLLTDSPNVFWNLTYHEESIDVSFDDWIREISSLIRMPHRISYLSRSGKLYDEIEFDGNIDFRSIDKSDVIGEAEYSYSKERTPYRFAIVTPDGLVYACNCCGKMMSAAKQPVEDCDMDCSRYYDNRPRKREPIGDLYAGEYNSEIALKKDKHIIDCLKYKKCWAYITQARIEYYAKLQGFL